MSKARKKYQSRTTIKLYDGLNAFNVTRDHFCRCHVLGVECRYRKMCVQKWKQFFRSATRLTDLLPIVLSRSRKLISDN